MPVFEWRSIMPVPVDELFAYHARPGAFARLAPPWQRLRILEQEGGMRDGGRVVFKVYVGPVGKRWVAEMGSYVEGRQFVDHQVEGPFASWEHTHRFLPGADDGASELLDHIEYSLPAGRFTDSIGAGPARKQLERLCRFRHARTRADLERHAVWADRPRLRVAISGASGLIGSSLAVYLTTAGHEVIRLVRRGAGGALAKMLPAFKWGLGTRLGDGNQWWAWIDLDDALAAVEWMLHDEELSGVVNVTAPEPVTNLEFTKTLGHVLHRPAALAAPRFAVAKGLGGMGEEMFLAHAAEALGDREARRRQRSRAAQDVAARLGELQVGR